MFSDQCSAEPNRANFQQEFGKETFTRVFIAIGSCFTSWPPQANKKGIKKELPAVLFEMEYTPPFTFEDKAYMQFDHRLLERL